MPIFLNPSKRTEQKGILQDSFYKASIILLKPKPEPQQENKKKKLQAKIPLNIDTKILNKILADQIQLYDSNNHTQ